MKRPTLFYLHRKLKGTVAASITVALQSMAREQYPQLEGRARTDSTRTQRSPTEFALWREGETPLRPLPVHLVSSSSTSWSLCPHQEPQNSELPGLLSTYLSQVTSTSSMSLFCDIKIHILALTSLGLHRTSCLFELPFV